MGRRAEMMKIYMVPLYICALSLPLRADLIDEEPTATPTPAATPEITPTLQEKSGGKSLKPAPKAGATKKQSEAKEKPVDAGPNERVLAPTKPKSKRDPSEKEPVKWRSDSLKGLKESGTFELIDNVLITQGTMDMRAKHATIFFDNVSNEVIKVVATGNVQIDQIDEETGEKIRALADKVTFENKERHAILEGNPRLWRGPNLIKGKKITYELDSGWIRVQQVEGEVHPEANQPDVQPKKSETSGAEK